MSLQTRPFSIPNLNFSLRFFVRKFNDVETMHWPNSCICVFFLLRAKRLITSNIIVEPDEVFVKPDDGEFVLWELRHWGLRVHCELHLPGNRADANVFNSFEYEENKKKGGGYLVLFWQSIRDVNLKKKKRFKCYPTFNWYSQGVFVSHGSRI